MSVKVKNLKGTSTKDCSVCGTWLNHWERLSGKKANECAVCTNKATVGGHVKKVGTSDMVHYIVPLCYGCNARDDEFLSHEPLVSALNCGK